ncbi:M50 family metallopeptidase [Alkalihalobacterium chitinilyticum]|uniref:M50 family metallopeptidase n=1 Tax=Alkalihalobacterium chitinilyticum TaxID=2980103 RepID=A0ABT5VBD4_9BACI|nr:M50 family metallopeptidase [Alkalihalobacterium chitinilyticum]MDE5412456.1 M50 family metallopeptidase [Alkalihalobacterium chitinilyticum]
MGIITGYFKEVIMVFLIVFIHEMGHVFAAKWFKWRISKIELLPFGGVAEMNESSNRPFREELIVIVSGPTQHLWMIGASFLLVQTPLWSTADHQLFVWHNLMILGFNLLPIWPLDGGRILHLACTYKLPYKQGQKLTLLLSTTGIVIIGMISLKLFPFHLNLWVVLSFLCIANYLEWKQRHYIFMRFLLDRFYLEERHLKRYSLQVHQNMKVRQVLEQFRRGHKHTITIDRNHCVSEKMLLDAYFNQKAFDRKLKEVFIS